MAGARGLFDVTNMNGMPACLYRRFAAYFLTLVVLTSQTGSEIPRPRGVSISKASLYVDGLEFTCLDGSATIPLERVNDDYCDCPGDGSDEPGTSACPNGAFHCTNAGYKPMNIFSSWVNDGICDCCDGSDEHEGIITCENTCREMGRHMREEAEKNKKLLEEGHKIYLEYSKRGHEALEEKQIRLAELETQKAELEEKRAALEELKKEVERPETEAKERHKKAWDDEKEKRAAEKEKSSVEDTFKDLDVNGDGAVSVPEMQSFSCFDIDNNGEVSEEEGREYLEDQEQVDINTFQEKVWPNIKEIYKKEEEQTTVPTPDDTTAQPPTPIPDPPTTDEPPSNQDDDLPPEDEDEEYRDYDEDDDELDDERDDEDDHDNKESDDTLPEYDEETKKLIEAADQARNDYNEVDRKFRDVERELKDLQKTVELDLGPDKEFYPLKGECYEYTDSQYTYRLCPFDRTSQRSKHGGSETSLGTWGQWEGPDNNRYSVMKYTHGQGCWNGPDRSVKVLLYCGLVSELYAASEPNRCEYEFKFRTPSACSSGPTPPIPDDHDEL